MEQTTSTAGCPPAEDLQDRLRLLAENYAAELHSLGNMSDEKRDVIVLGGRFQPFHPGHASTIFRLLDGDVEVFHPDDRDRLVPFRWFPSLLIVAVAEKDLAVENWLSVGTRRRVILAALAEEKLRGRILVEPLPYRGRSEIEATRLRGYLPVSPYARILYVTGNPRVAQAYRDGGIPHLRIINRPGNISATAIRNLLIGGRLGEARKLLHPAVWHILVTEGHVERLREFAQDRFEVAPPSPRTTSMAPDGRPEIGKEMLIP